MSPLVVHSLCVLFLLTSLISSIKTQFITKATSFQDSPHWLGSFYTTTQCDTDKCCCIYGLLTLFKLSPNYLRFVGRHFGYNCPSDQTIDVLTTMPTGYITAMTISDVLIDMTLSDDSNTLKFYNPFTPSCNGSALRNSSNSKSISIQIQILFLIFIVLLSR